MIVICLIISLTIESTVLLSRFLQYADDAKRDCILPAASNLNPEDY